MDNHDKIVEELNALIASYVGGNSFAERSARARAQRRDRFGRFAEMFGLMKFKLRLGSEYGNRAGEEVNVQGVYVGAGNTETSGWMYVKGDANVPDGFYEIEGNNFREVLASLDPEYLAKRGIELGKDASGNAVGKRTLEDIPSTDRVAYMKAPPGFTVSSSSNDSYNSEDGDISIEGDGSGLYDVYDNLDRGSQPIRNVEGLTNALKAVYQIDSTRSNYEPAEGEAPATPAPSTPEAPVAELPQQNLADPAGMTNAELTAEGSTLFGADGRPFPLADRERASQILDEMDARAELEPDGYEGDWFADNADFVRDPSKSEAPVAELPETTQTADAVEQAEADVQNSEQVVEETADPATVEVAEEVIATEAPVVEQAPIKPPRSPREPSIGAFTGRMAELLDGVTDAQQVKDIINGEEITYIDFETSGFSAVPGDGALNRPLQMGIVKVKNGEVTDRRNLWMNPEEQLSEWSRNNLKDADGNPLTDEWLATQPSMQDALQEAVAFIGPDAILGGQNVQFDLEVLTRSLREQGIDFSFAGTVDSRDLGKKTLPTWSAESPVGPTKTDADGNKSPSNSLGDLIAFLQDDGYDVTLDNWHSADADAQATHELVQALLQRAVDNNVDMGILTDKAQRDAESASEWANYADEYDAYVADLGAYFDQTNDPNKEQRLALATPLTPESFGLVQSDGGDNQPPVTPDALAEEEPEDFNVLKEEILEKYPVNATSRVRMFQRSQADERDPQEIADEIDGFIERLRRSTVVGPRGTVNEFITQLNLYKEQSSQASRDERAAREQRVAEQDVLNAQAREERIAEEDARYQSWLDAGGPAKVEELFAKISQIRRDALFNGTLPEGYDRENSRDLFNLRDDIANEIKDIASVDGVISSRALSDITSRGGGRDIADRFRMGVVSDLDHFNQRRIRDEANPEMLNNIFSEYDKDGSARALFDSGASYDEIYANLEAQDNDWARGYDPYWRMAEFLGGVSEDAHEREMSVIRRAVELRDNARPVIEDAPSLDEELRTAIQNGNALQVIEARRRKDAIDSVVDSVNADIPVVDATPGITEVPSETVTEIPTVADYQFDLANPTAEELRLADALEKYSTGQLRTAVREAVVDGKQEVTIDGNTYPLSTVALALYNSDGMDTEGYIAVILDGVFGGTDNVNALVARRRATSDVTREEEGTTGQPSPQEVLETWLSTAPLIDIVVAYTTAVGNGEDNVTVSLEDFGMPESQGTSNVDIPVQEVRQRLSDSGYDMDTVDGNVERNQQASEQVAEASGLSVEDATASARPRTDWRDVLNRGSQEFRDVYFIDKNGDVQRYERREDGKWYEMHNPAAPGKTTAALIRKITRDADPEVLMEIDDGDPHDEDPTYDYNAHTFQLGSEQDEEIAIDETIANDAWMHVSGGDLEAMQALQRAGVTFNILDKMAELFPNAERRGDDEVVTETHEYTDPATGTRYRFEVVVTRTADEYFYTYVRRTNLSTNESWSARVGHMAQSPFATFNNYRREISKFHASFFNGKGPVNWFDSDATRRRKKRDVLDPDTNQWVHAKDIQNNPQTMANIRALLGINPASTNEARRAEDAVMRSILNAISKYRFNERWMGIMAGRISAKYGRNISPEFMYQVADVYEAHMTNQNNLDRYGTWVSFDQRTPLDAGDTVEHVSGRRGTVRKRLGWVDSLGRYRYSDYLEVRWDNGDTSWTTSRMNRLIQTSGGTDGSERIGYRNGYEDPRADYGTSVADPASVPVPEFTHTPAPPVTMERVQVTRNENSELVLPDGTVIPERPVGVNGTLENQFPDTIQEGMFIRTINDDLESVISPVIRYGVDGAPAGGVAHDVAIRNADGTYTVRTVAWTAGQMENNIQVREFPNRGNATPAQINEVLELLGTKLLNENQELPAGLVRGLMYQAILTGVDVRPYTTREELTDIIQELRALPDRPQNRAEDAAMLADVASVEAERNNNADASQEFGALADGANIVSSQSTSEERTESSSVKPPTLLAGREERSESPVNMGAMNGTQILYPEWLDNAPTGTRIWSTSSGRMYEKDSEGVWRRVVSGQVTTEAFPANLIRDRVLTGQLYVGGAAPTILPPGAQATAAGDRNPDAMVPSPLSGITPDVSAGWVDVPAGTQINNPDWFSGAPVGTQVTLANVEYEKKDDGKWYPTTGDFTSIGYSSETLGSLGLTSRTEQQSEEEAPRVWELLPEGSVISDAFYITSAPIGSSVSLQLADGSEPLKFSKLGNGKWELANTSRQFTNEQLVHRFQNSEANTFSALPSEEQTTLPATVTSLSQLRAYPVGATLHGATPAGHYRRFSRNSDGKWYVQSRNGSPNYWTDEQVMQAVRRGTVVNTGNNVNRFAPSSQPAAGQRGATPARTGTRRPNSTSETPITYTPGSFQTDVTPEQFREIIRSGNTAALRRLILSHLEGKTFGKYELDEIRVGDSSFSAKIVTPSGRTVGTTTREFRVDGSGNLYVYNAYMELVSSARGGGFASIYTEAMYDFYRALGIQEVRVSAGLSEGGYTWGNAGFDFSDGEVPSSILRNMRNQLSLAISEGRMQDAMYLENLIQRALRGGSDRPTANEIATIPGQLEYYPTRGGTLGREIMAETGWGGRRRVPTLEESLAFMERLQRRNEALRNAQQQNGWNR
jgi:DNA polymerase III epsilon subunit-like protein